MKNSPLFYKEEDSYNPFHSENKWIKQDFSCKEPNNMEKEDIDNEEHLLY